MVTSVPYEYHIVRNISRLRSRYAFFRCLFLAQATFSTKYGGSKVQHSTSSGTVETQIVLLYHSVLYTVVLQK